VPFYSEGWWASTTYGAEASGAPERWGLGASPWWYSLELHLPTIALYPFWKHSI
jgi:hypothetical protein